MSKLVGVEREKGGEAACQSEDVLGLGYKTRTRIKATVVSQTSSFHFFSSQCLTLIESFFMFKTIHIHLLTSSFDLVNKQRNYKREKQHLKESWLLIYSRGKYALICSMLLNDCPNKCPEVLPRRP